MILRGLDELCDDDAGLKVEVEELLPANADDRFLDSKVLDAEGEIAFPIRGTCFSERSTVCNCST